MIYLDNSATTLCKPPEVSEAVAYAMENFGNAGRSFYEPVARTNREIYRTRAEIARLAGLSEPLNVAFTSSFTESLNLVVQSLVRPEDTVITTLTEHNSVLRPLYLRGCTLRFLDCDDCGVLNLDALDELYTPGVRFMFCTQGSNVTGNITPTQELYRWCKAKGITLVLDIAQTFGSVPVSVDEADIFCFTGHKGLFGPQGTGGIIVKDRQPFTVVKTGGAGTSSFAPFQPTDMPDVFEVGTLNAPGIYGLQKGVHFINTVGLAAIQEKERALTQQFLAGIRELERVTLYGDFSTKDRLPLVALNVEGIPSSELAERLWEEHAIATRAGSHCAPLLHQRLGTAETGMVRFSFSYFNTADEVATAVAALRAICV